MKRNGIVAAGLCAFLVVSAIGCGTKEETDQPVTVEQAEIMDNEQEENREQAQENDASQTNEEKKLEDKKEVEVLDGNVKSIGKDSAVIIKTKTEETDEGLSLAIVPAEGYETEEDLVDVSFTENTSFELHVVKNGGKNPDEDVSIKEASLADMEEGVSLTLEGYYEENIFIAEKVIIYEFV